MILFAAIVAAFVIAGVVLARSHQAAFDEKFPPISDAEFVSRCPPGTSPEVALRVRRVLAEALNIEYERIYPESRLVTDLGAE